MAAAMGDRAALPVHTMYTTGRSPIVVTRLPAATPAAEPYDRSRSTRRQTSELGLDRSGESFSSCQLPNSVARRLASS